MYHSITIGDKNTWNDWHLIPSSRPLVNPPNVRASMVEIPGADGLLDLSDALVGRPTYANRSGSWDFYVDNNHGSWADRYSEIMAYLHGQKMTAVLEDDPLFYYDGRFSVNQWRSDPYYSRIVIDYNVGPYKLYSATEGDLWLWDPFNFNEDVIRSYRNMVVKRGVPLIVNVEGDVMDIVPIITVAVSGMSLTFNGGTTFLLKGSHTYDSVVIRSGDNELTFNYNGSNASAKVSLKMTGGKF